MYIAFVIIFCIAVSFAIHYCMDAHRERMLNFYKMSFKESMDLTELPIITLYQDERKFNFLLDTGSNNSIISKPASRILKGTYTKCSYKLNGLGSTDITKVCNTTLEYKDLVFEVDFLVSDGVSATFNVIKKESGVNIHGILGTKFFKKYKYVLDFDKLAVYKK